MYITDDSIDDLLFKVFKRIKKSGKQVTPTKGTNLEVLGINLCLKNPRSRISKSLKKGKLFSALGELLWYLTGSNLVDQISYYIPGYEINSDDGHTIHGAYGPRLLGSKDHNQIESIIDLLKKKKSTRRAVIQLFRSTDLQEDYNDIPCTTNLQFLVRDNHLHMFVNMRSNDAYKGLPHDIFAFTMIQEIFARSLNVKLGYYHHYAASLHLYQCDLDAVESYLSEGYYPSNPMPAMPNSDPWSSIHHLLKAEKDIRTGNTLEVEITKLDNYWKDISRVLLWFKKFKSKDDNGCQEIENNLHHAFYKPYLISKKMQQRNKKQLKLI